MTGCIAEADLKQMAAEILLGFDKRIALIPSDLCAPFHYEARNLETELLAMYKVIAVCCRSSEDLGQISKNWAMMVSICDESAKKLGALAENHPSCGANQYYDRVLDLRNKCQRLQEMHS